MRKYIAIFFLSVYLVAFTEARQVLKLPDLVQHFIAHKLRDHNTTLYSFIKMHYLDAPVKDADYKQDMKLPFKIHEMAFAPVSIVPAPKVFDFSPILQSVPQTHISNFGYTEPFSDAGLSSVFRPPILG